jgi:hypothetical protein
MSDYPNQPAPYCFLYRKKLPEFIVKSKRLLSDKQLYQIARTVIQQHKDALFKIWKFKNPSWRGNVSVKQRALLRASPLPNPVILEIPYTESLLKGKSLTKS